MASQNAGNDLPPEKMSINLQIVSPSVGVSRPLQFPTTPAITTIKALKGMIREALPIRPADSHQRLIYRGKALVREEQSLLEVMGAENVRNADQHTIHLVLRDVENPPAPTPTVPNASTANRMPGAMPSLLDQLGRGLGRPPVAGGGPHGGQAPQPNTQPRMPSPAPLSQQLPPPAAAAFQQQHQQLTSWLNQVQREAMTRAVNQNQRGRAQAGMRGVADTARDSSSRRGSPAPTHTIYRETHGPNGRSFHVETVIRNGAPASPVTQNGGYNSADIESLLRSIDAGHATPAMGAAMQRTASGAPLPSRHGPTLLNMASAPQLGSQPNQGLDLYLVSSPEGPRGILINNSTMETFYTPREHTPAPTPAPPPRVSGNMTIREFLMAPPGTLDIDDDLDDILDELGMPGDPAWETEPRHHHALARTAAPGQVQVNAQGQAQAQPPVHAPGLAPVQGENEAAQRPPRDAMGWLIHIMGFVAPHFWNIVRLGFFVWLFVGPNSSWTRWFVVISAAIIVFIAGTGALNGMGDHMWRPILRQLETLFPTLDRQHQQQPQVPGTEAGDAEPNPADMAARLVAERNQRRPWLSEQMRRIERAGMLFIASIAPGVAERHIANLEEEARQEERRRQEAEAAAAAAAAEAAAAAAETEKQALEGGEKAEGSSSSDAAASGTSPQATPDAAVENNRDQPPAREPLIAL